MLILAVDSATPVAGVALLNEDKVLYEEFANYKKTHSETLMPMIDKVLTSCDCRLDDIEAIALTVGPGSFTGLRIGMGTVKGLSMASGKPVVAVSTLDVLAANIIGSNALVCSLLDARKQEVYAGIYDVGGKFPRRLGKIMACSPQEFAETALKISQETEKERVILLGDGYYPYADYFKDYFKDRLIEVPAHLMLPKAATAGSLGLEKAKKQEYTDIMQLRPVYIRLSEAEYRLKRGEI